MKVASGNVLWRQRKRNWCRTPFTFTVYTLTDRELSVKTGILNERFNLIKLFRIVDISVERTFLQRIFGMSTLVLDTRDQSSGNGVVALKNVINGFEVRQVLQEAVAFGKPIVTTDNVGCREAVEHNQNGFLIPVRDSHALADAVRKLLAQPELRARFGIQSRLLAERDFDSVKLTQRILTELYEL